MAVRNLQSKPIFAWIPPDTQTAFKITVEYSNGEIEDLTDKITDYMIEDFATESIGNFEFWIDDPDEEYVVKFKGNEIFRYYKDYLADAVTLRFRGRVEKPSNRGNRLNVKGRAEGKAMLDITVTKQFIEVECSQILSSIFATYLPQFTLNNVTESEVFLTINWYQKNFFDCVRDLCIASGFECYIDSNLDVHFFRSGSVNNETDAIVGDYNMLDLGDFTPDLQLIKNRIIVYGAVQQGIQIIKTAEDESSIAEYGVREQIINDDNVTSDGQGTDVANYYLEELRSPPEVGDITGVMLATVQPGENVRISSQEDGLYPGYYFTKGYRDRFSTDTFQTTLYLNKEPRKFSHVMRDRVESENRLQQTSINPEEMRQSYNFIFTSITGTFNNTQLSSGRLIATSVGGTWISPNLVLTKDLIEAYPIINGDRLTDINVFVSGNTGLTYDKVTNRVKKTLTQSIGRNVRVKVEFLSTDAQIESLGMLYNTN